MRTLTEAEAQRKWGTKGCSKTICWGTPAPEKLTRWQRFKQLLRELQNPFDVFE